jgi:hypothetical protein
VSLVLEFLAEIVFEVGVKGLGYVILSFISKKEPDPDGWPAVTAGILAWIIIAVIVIVAWKQFSK